MNILRRFFKKAECDHEWSVYCKARYFDEDGVSREETTIICRKCGKKMVKTE